MGFSMSCVRLGTLFLFAAFAGSAAPAAAQNSGKEAKPDKSPDAKTPLKSGPVTSSQATPARTPLDKIKLPKDAILVLIESAKDAARYATMYWVEPEYLEALHEKLRS